MATTVKTLIALGIASLALVAGSAQAEKGDWIIRGGVTYVVPEDFSTPFGDTGSVKFDVSDEATFGFNVTWMFHDNWGIELLAVIPPEHSVKAPAVADVDIISAEVLPPTLSLQYHFLPEGTFRPYIGVGMNYTMFSNEKIIEGTLKIDDSTGFAADLGADIALGERWVVNIDIRYLQIDLTIQQTIDDDVYPKETYAIDPMVYSLMVGYRFGN